jgi:outer membrane protein insertion porin family
MANLQKTTGTCLDNQGSFPNDAASPRAECSGMTRFLAAICVVLGLCVSAGFADGLPGLPSKTESSSSQPGENVAASTVEGEPIVEVRVIGNKSMPLEKITPHIRIRAGRPFSMKLLQEDARSLDNTRMFVNIKTYTQRVQNGIVVIFDVLERPMLMDVLFVGNVKVNKKALQKEAKVKVGDPVDPFAIEESRRTLEDYYRRKGFDKVRVTLLEGSKPEDRRAIYLINEGSKQKIQIVKFVGNSISSGGRLRTQIDSAHPTLYLFKGELDRKKLDEDVEKLMAYYRGLGFFRARIGREVRDYDTNEDGDPEAMFSRVAREFNQWETVNWVVVTFIIDEGPRYKIRNIAVNGNKKYSGEELLAEMKLKNGEYFNQAKMTSDMMTMQDVYGGNGYVFAKVTPQPRFLEEDATLDLIYNMEEGSRYSVGKIDVVIKGEYPHTKITTILNRMSLHPGEIVDTRELRASERRIKSSQLFNVNPGEGEVPKIGYRAPESDEEEQLAERPKSPKGYRGQSPDVPEPPAAKSSESYYYIVEKRQSAASEPDSVPPMYETNVIACDSGDNANADATHDNPYKIFAKNNANGSQYNSPRPQATRNNSAPTNNSNRQDTVVRFQYTASSGGVQQPFQSQLPGLSNQRTRTTAGANRNYANAGTTAGTTQNPAVRNAAYDDPYGSTTDASSSAPMPPNSYPAQPGTTQPNNFAGTNNGSYPVNAQPNAYPANTTNNGQPAGVQPGANTTGRAEPYPFNAANAQPEPVRPVPSVFPSDSRFIGGPVEGELPPRPLTLNPFGEETTTGRFMFGVGINSDAGLFGSIVIDEQNFSLLKFPRRWEEFKNATAFRGNGERLHIEAVPGTQVQRYSISWQNPYIFDTKNSLGVSGFYYSRQFTNWFEQRIGGSVSVGRQFTPDLSGSLAYRGAQVNISNPNVYDIPQINEVLGNNALHGFSVTGSYDTRDNPFLATEGHLITAQFEEVVGSWVYPRASLDMRKHFKLYERPDGSGRHTLTISGKAEYTGPDTPIYENVFYGGFSSIRGFAYRGVSPMVVSTNPVVRNVAVGGEFGMLASAEYMFPITADDMLRAVVFCDTGTVEPSINNWRDNYRVAPGFGLRITVPAMGPAPIALDFAFPVASNPGDVHEMFSFFVGFGR